MALYYNDVCYNFDPYGKYTENEHIIFNSPAVVDNVDDIILPQLKETTNKNEIIKILQNYVYNILMQGGTRVG